MNEPDDSLDALAVVRKIYELVAQGDAAGITPFIAPEFVATQAASLPFGGDWRGREGFAKMGAAIYAAWPDFKVEPEQFLADGDTVLVRTRVKGGEGALDQPMIERWRIVGGHAAECQPYYFDAAAAAASAKRP